MNGIHDKSLTTTYEPKINELEVLLIVQLVKEGLVTSCWTIHWAPISQATATWALLPCYLTASINYHQKT